MGQKYLDLKGRDFLSLRDFSSDEFYHILNTSIELKSKLRRGETHELLHGKTLGLVFSEHSTRTRSSFETAMTQLGGHAQFLWTESLQMSGPGKEPLRDTSRVLSRYLDAIAIRPNHYRDEDVYEMAKYASVPVINAASLTAHPCQATADLLTMLEKKRKLEGIKLAFCWTFGLWPKPPTTVYDLMSMGSKLGMDLVYGCPEGYEPKEDVETAKKVAKETKGSLEIVRSLEEAASGADVIYLKSWVLPGLKDPKKEAAHLREPDKYRNWIVNNDLLDAAKRDVIVMNAMPAIRGEELTEEVFEGPHSVLFDEAENRLHAQKGILSLLL